MGIRGFHSFLKQDERHLTRVTISNETVIIHGNTLMYALFDIRHDNGRYTGNRVLTFIV